MRPTVVVDRIGRSSAQLIGVLIAMLGGQHRAARAAVGAALRARRRHRLVLAAPDPAQPAARTGGRCQSAGSARREPGRGQPGRPERVGAGPRHRRTVTIGAGVGKRHRGGFWRFTGPRALATLAQITIQRIDIVLVAIILGPAEAAIYTAATRFLVAGQFGNAAVTRPPSRGSPNCSRSTTGAAPT